MIYTARTELLAKTLSGCEPKICDCDSKTVVEAEHVLWLQVAVINTEAMAILDCVKQLQKYMLDKIVVPQVPTAVQDLAEQVPVAGILHDNVCVVVLLDHSMQGGDTRMC